MDRIDLSSSGTVTGRTMSDPMMQQLSPELTELQKQALEGIKEALVSKGAVFIGLDSSTNPDEVTITYNVLDDKLQGIEADFVIIDDYAAAAKMFVALDAQEERMRLSYDFHAFRGYGKSVFHEMYYQAGVRKLKDLMPVREAHFEAEPVKQNGRSAAYLSMDKTKNHKRTRK